MAWFYSVVSRLIISIMAAEDIGGITSFTSVKIELVAQADEIVALHYTKDTITSNSAPKSTQSKQYMLSETEHGRYYE